MNPTDERMVLLQQAKTMAQHYRELTGRPLSLSNDIAVFEAVRLLGLVLAPVRSDGYEIIRNTPHGIQRLQVKSRVMSSPKLIGGLLGRFDDKQQWDAVLFVLLDPKFNALKIFEAPRATVLGASTPGFNARKERSSLSATVFCENLSRQIWPA